MDTYLDKNDEVIIPVPTFKIFDLCASLIDAKRIFISYQKDLSFPTDKVISSISNKTKMVIIVNPNNPTGTSVDKKDIIKIVKKAKNALILIDEAYYQFLNRSSKDLIDEYQNIAVTQTFSKAFGLAGLRLGYILSNKKIIEDLKKVNLPYDVNTISIIAANAALKDLNFVKESVKKIKKNKDFLSKEIKKLGIKVFKSQANFILAYFGERSRYVKNFLKKNDILVRDVSSYELLDGCIRIGIGSNKECEKVVNTLKNVLREDVILFDMDGVLVDVSFSYRLAIKKTAEYFLKEKIELKEIQQFKEKGGLNNDWDLTEAILRSKNLNIPKQKIIDKFQSYYLGNKEEKGLRENEKWLLSKKILKKLYTKYKLGIVTGRPKKETLFILKKEGVKDYFDVIISADDIPSNKGKPDPYPIILALKKLNSEKATYIGDSIDDFVAANKAGIKFIGNLPSNIEYSNVKNYFKKEKVEKIIENIDQIYGVLK